MKALENNVGAVPQFRLLVAVRSPQRPGFIPRAVLVGFVTHKLEVGQVSLRALQFSPFRLITTVLRTYSFVYSGRNEIPEIDIFLK